MRGGELEWAGAEKPMAGRTSSGVQTQSAQNETHTSMLVALLLVALVAAYVSATAELRDAAYEDVFPGLTPEALMTVMHMPYSALPPLPLPGDLSTSNLDFLKSPKKKLTGKRLQERRSVFTTYWNAHFAREVSLTSFQAWIAPVYDEFLNKLGVRDASHMYQAAQRGHRSAILGLWMAFIVSQPGVALALSQFSVLDPSETKFYTGYIRGSRPVDDGTRRVVQTAMDEDEARRAMQALPAAFDMRDWPGETMPPIRDQQQCGACYAFAALGAMELQYMYRSGPASGELSEGAVVECSPYDCNGGNAGVVLNWVSYTNGGIPTRAQYPYPDYVSSSVPTPSCNTSNLHPTTLSTNDVVSYLPTSTSAPTVAAAEAAIMTAVYAGRPVIIALAGGSACFQGYNINSDYNTNPYTEQSIPGFTPVLNCSCGTDIDHNVLVIGWTATSWICRNQWNTWWGINGYLYLPRSTSTDMVMPDGGQCAMYLENPMVIGEVTAASPLPTKAPTPPTTQSPTTLRPVTASPTLKPSTTTKPSSSPTSKKPSVSPSSKKPSASPSSKKPSASPVSKSPTRAPTPKPTTSAPTLHPVPPTSAPVTVPTTLVPTLQSAAPSSMPSLQPSSAAPSTAAPSTAAPSTAAPSTAAPSTAAPSTAAPSTAAPSTAAPSSAAPSSLAPSTAKPIAQATGVPVSAQPTSHAPSSLVTTLKPTTKGPTTPKPTTKGPTTPKPTTNKPTTRKPTTLIPTTRKPNTAKPTTKKPTTAKPTTKKPSTNG